MEKQLNLNHEIYNAIANVICDHQCNGENVKRDEILKALEWFEIHFFTADYEDGEE